MVVKEDWVRVELPPDVQDAAEALGKLRHEQWDPRVTIHGYLTPANNRLGAFGEYGFCHLLGKPHPHPDGRLESELAHGSDCYGWEVRCASRPTDGLGLHRGDEGKRFILALGHEIPGVVWIAGCLDANTGFRVGKWRVSEDGEGDINWCRVDQRHLRSLGPPHRPERAERANGYRPAVAAGSYAAQGVRDSLKWHRRLHRWKPGQVWITDPRPGPCMPGHEPGDDLCAARKACGQYVWPDRGES